eukprot:TRINITY_DN4951_c0_g1_i2.p2 TRINITY_DN4951_c0_g1~~TRINITY_DN4951_c0_g1_i2.p2  ORF type:complete len:388 (-),score=24.87 TRINITY_DN4951_c0_g1_i2:126-1202(-)
MIMKRQQKISNFFPAKQQRILNVQECTSENTIEDEPVAQITNNYDNEQLVSNIQPQSDSQHNSQTENDDCNIQFVNNQTSGFQISTSENTQFENNNLSYVDPASGPEYANISRAPTQPILQEYPKRLFGNRQRSFNPDWYNVFKWVEYSEQQDAVYCQYCRLFCKKNNICKSQILFVNEGFSNWKCAMEKKKGLYLHNHSKQHIEAAQNYIEAKRILDGKQKSVASLLVSSRAKQVENNRENLKKIIDIILFLAFRGLSLRGKDESSTSVDGGNFREMVIRDALKDPSLENFLESNKNNNYTSPKIQNELLQITCEILFEKIVSDIKISGSNIFSLIVDETAEQEQLRINCSCCKVCL